jgi:hypothetical protein
LIKPLGFYVFPASVMMWEDILEFPPMHCTVPQVVEVALDNIITLWLYIYRERVAKLVEVALNNMIALWLYIYI